MSLLSLKVEGRWAGREQEVSCPGCSCSIHFCPPGSCERRSWHFPETLGAGMAFESCGEMAAAILGR